MFRRQLAEKEGILAHSRIRHIPTKYYQFLGSRCLACARMPALAVPGDVCAVGALGDDALDERRALPAIAALRAIPLLLRRAALSEMKASSK